MRKRFAGIVLGGALVVSGLAVGPPPVAADVCEDVHLPSCGVDVRSPAGSVVKPVTRPILDPAAAEIVAVDAEIDEAVATHAADGVARYRAVVDAADSRVNDRVALLNSVVAGAQEDLAELCDLCTPGVIGPIGPFPIGPSGHELMERVYVVVAVANELVDRYRASGERLGARVCDECTPGVLGPVGPFPIGPSGHEGGPS